MPLTNPYVGPKPLSRNDPIFGREQELRELRYLLTSERIVLLHSPSGAGKSSLVNARGGLCDQLRTRFDVWLPTRVSQAPDIAVANRYVWSAVVGFEHELPERLQRAPELLAAATLKDYVARRPRRPGAPANVLLIFDQFEEILRVDPVNAQGKTGFFSQLGEMLLDHTVWALFVLREDYLAPLDPYVRSVPTHLKQRYRIDLLRREQAREAVVTLAQEGGRPFTAEAADRLLTDLAAVNVQNEAGEFVKQTGEFVEPLQMQVVCRSLWDRIPAGAETIGPEHVEQFGNVTAALGDYYAASVQSIAGGVNEREWTIRQWVGEKLITPDGIRNRVLRGAKQSEGLDSALVQMLVEAHLVRGEERGGTVWYELTHDRLIDPIRGNNRQWSEARLSTVEKRAILWRSEQSEGLLFVGDELKSAKAWAAPNRPVVDLREFLAACEEKQARLNKERRQTLALRRALALANSGRLATTALLNKENRVDLAALLSVEARRAANSFEARNSLLLSLQANPGLISILHNSGRVFCVAFSPDGKVLASASSDNKVRLWDVASRQPLGDPLQGHFGGVYCLAFSPDSRILASASPDKTVRLWDAASRQPLGDPLRGHSGPVKGVAFSPDGKTLASTGLDKTVRLWDVASRQPLGDPLQGDPAGGLSVAFSPDGRTLASAGRGATVRLWDVASRQPLGDPLKAQPGSVDSLALSPDGKMLASASDDHTVRLWDVASRQSLGDLLQGHSGNVRSVAFSPDGKMLASASDDQTVRLWDVANRQPLGNPLKGHSGPVWSVAFSPDGKMLASANNDGTVLLWDAASRQPLGDPLKAQPGSVESIALSPDGKMLALANRDYSVRLRDVATRLLLGDPLQGHTLRVRSVAFSSDGKMLASASEDQTVRLWDAASRQPLGDPLKGHSAAVRSVAFSPDGKMLASASEDQTVRLWDVASHQPLGDPLKGHRGTVSSIAFSRDGTRLASTGADKTVWLWNVASRQPLGDPLQGNSEYVYSLAFSPDGKMLASAGYDPTVRLWDVASRRPLGVPLKGHSDPVWSVAFSPDGKLLASASADASVRLWDVASHQALGDPLKGHTGRVSSVAFSPDGKILASAGDDQTVWLWDVDPDSWAARLCPLANRNLSMTEWQQYIGPNVPYRRTCPALPPGEGAPAK